MPLPPPPGAGGMARTGELEGTGGVALSGNGRVLSLVNGSSGSSPSLVTSPPPLTQRSGPSLAPNRNKARKDFWLPGGGVVAFTTEDVRRLVPSVVAVRGPTIRARLLSLPFLLPVTCSSALPRSVPEAPERSVLSCLSRLSPHSPVGRRRSHRVAAAGVVSGAVPLGQARARPAPGAWPGGGLRRREPAPSPGSIPWFCQPVSLWRDPCPGVQPPPSPTCRTFTFLP